MQLTSFRVTNYRSINDSSTVPVGHRTALVGRNESGKTSLLRVLASLNPPDELVVFSLTRDFPRDRKRSEFDDTLPVLSTEWALTETEAATLTKLYPRANATSLTVRRDYAGGRKYAFAQRSLNDLGKRAPTAVRAVTKALSAATKKAPAVEQAVRPTVAALVAVADGEVTGPAWGTAVLAASAALRSAYVGAGGPAHAGLESAFAELESQAKPVATFNAGWPAAEAWLDEQLPAFVYLDDWDDVPGHYVISEYVTRTQRGQQKKSDRMFAKLLKVADLDAAELQKLASASHEERKLLTDRAGRVMTKTLRRLWTDREITVDFSVDADHFDVLVKDVDTDALVPLDERSRGFRWYFSFFVTFAADTDGGDKANAVLLLDEPGLFLHATAQDNLLRFLDTLQNQILYTTHSPFMIDPERLDAVRTVNLVEGAGTTVTADPTGDANTLFPLQAALGYSLSQTLFVGPKNVVVEGVTDYWYLSTASDHLRAAERTGLRDGVVLTPAGGAQKAPFMVALLTSQRMKTVVLFDSEPRTEETAKQMIQERLIRNDGVIFVGHAFEPERKGADLEDLLDEATYVRLVEETHAKELAGRDLVLNPKVPRVIARVEAAFASLGVAFYKTRPASLWVRTMAANPSTVWSEATAARFERLFALINAAVAKLEDGGRKPFA